MALLPQLKYEYNERSVTDVFAGYRHRLKIAEGEFFDMKNLSSSFYPLLANRKKRGLVQNLSAPGGILAKEKLAWVENGILYYGGEATPLTGLSAGEKQMVSMGAYLCIFPDKVYFNTADPSDYGSMEARYTSAGRIKYTPCRKDGTPYESVTVSATAPSNPNSGDYWVNTSGAEHTMFEWSSVSVSWVQIPTVYTKITFLSEGELPGLFKENDAVSISGSTQDLNGEKILYGVGGAAGAQDYIIVVGLLDQETTQTTGFVAVARSVPDLDYVCEAKNRLWGCKYGVVDGKNLNEIYCCALGDFKNWRQYLGLSTDSWTASVGSDGPWTGAVNYLGYPMFFKEDRIHRVSISSTGAHQISETVCRGVQLGSSKSLQVVNELLIYKSRTDVCAYQGSFPESLSEALGDELYSDAIAGALGDRYYISMKNGAGERNLFVLDLKRGIWIREDDLDVSDFARLGDELYCVAGGALLALMGTDGTPEPYVSWAAETGMLYYQYPDRKYVSRFNIRLWMEEGAEVDVYLMYDSNGEWVRQGRIKMKGTRTVTLPIRPRRCDHMQMRLVGKGDVKLYSIARILSIGSDVG